MERQKITESKAREEWMSEAKKQTLETPPAFLKKLTEDYEHDYGTICHAIAAAGIGAAWAVERTPQGGITGFQAGAIMWEMIEGWGVFGEGPKRMTTFNDMLYPQYSRKFRSITPDTWAWLQNKAKENLKDPENVSPNVLAHWESVAAGEVPFGYRVETDL